MTNIFGIVAMKILNSYNVYYVEKERKLSKR